MFDATDEFLEESSLLLGFRIRCAGQRYLHRQDPLRAEAGIDGQKLYETSQEETGAREKQDRQRRLRNDEEPPQALRGAALARAASAFFKHLVVNAAAGFQRRRETKQDSRVHGHNEGEQQSAQVNLCGHDARQSGSTERYDQLQQNWRQQQP